MSQLTEQIARQLVPLQALSRFARCLLAVAVILPVYGWLVLLPLRSECAELAIHGDKLERDVAAVGERTQQHETLRQQVERMVEPLPAGDDRGWLELASDRSSLPAARVRLVRFREAADARGDSDDGIKVAVRGSFEQLTAFLGAAAETTPHSLQEIRLVGDGSEPLLEMAAAAATGSRPLASIASTASDCAVRFDRNPFALPRSSTDPDEQQASLPELRLIGTVLTDGPGRALVARAGEPAFVVAVGATLAGAKVAAIEPERVILSWNDGRASELRLASRSRQSSR